MNIDCRGQDLQPGEQKLLSDLEQLQDGRGHKLDRSLAIDIVIFYRLFKNWSQNPDGPSSLDSSLTEKRQLLERMTEALTALTAVQNDPAFPALKLDIAWHGIADEKMMSRLFSRLEQVNVAASDLRAKMHGKKDMQLQNSMSAAGILILGAFDRCGVKYSNRETSLFYLVMKRLFGDQLETVAFQKVRNKNGLRNIIDEAIRKHKVENVQRANQSAANNAINRL